VAVSLLAAGLALIVAACSKSTDQLNADRPSPERVLTVSEALRAGNKPVSVRGYVLVKRDGQALLCTGLAGSYPPQCGSPSLVVKGLDPTSLTGRESSQGIVWSGETTLTGTMAGGVLTLG
jgi:hypothetical protein